MSGERATGGHGAARADVEAAARQASLDESAAIVSTLVRATGDWDLAEDCMQDALVRALDSWARDGIPRNPGAWLTTVARNRAIDLLRRKNVEKRAVRSLGFEQEAAGNEDTEMTENTAEVDDRLSLIFTCCHPALQMDARVALTLRTVAGLTVAEIARAFLLPEATMQKRLVRARAKIKNAGIPFRVPPAAERADRLAGVLAVLYLLFNEGYASTGNEEFVRDPLAREAIRLGRMLVESLGESASASGAAPEAMGLLALMLQQHSRRDGRVDASGELVTLEDQDRSLWDRAEVAEAVALIQAADARLAHDASPQGPYLIQARIAACHATAPSFAETDFGMLVSLYRELARVTPSPIVDLNLAVAIAMAEGPAAGLPLIEELEARGALGDYYLLPATHADLLRRLGRGDEALVHYRRALEGAPSDVERRYLLARIRAL